MIYTDGGCHNHGDRKGVGSYAWLEPVDLSNQFVDVYGRYVEDSTNNRTEMLAVINAINHINKNHGEDGHCTAHIISDSGYVVKGYTHPSYLDRWVANGWRTSTNTPVQNIDLWEEFIRLSWHTGLKFELIKGHNKDKNPIHAFWNNIVDSVCTYIMDNTPRFNTEFHVRYDLHSHEITLIGEKADNGQTSKIV